MKKLVTRTIKLIKQNPHTTILIIVAAVLHLLVILPSGSHYCFKGACGDFYWGVHEHDGIWHIAVAAASFKIFPPINPIFAGSLLSGYNSLLDFGLYLFSLVGLSPFLMYFKILPIIWFILFTSAAIRLSNKINTSKLFIFLFLFLSYFGASFSFIIPLIRNHNFEGTSSLLAMQQILILTNLQLAYSYIFIFFTLILLHEKKLVAKHIIFLFFLIFFEWGLKFYTGFISTSIAGFIFLFRWLKERNLKYILFLSAIVISSVVSIYINYNPFGQLGSGVPFIFNPLALIWPLIEDKSMFYSYYWSNAKYTLLESTKFSPRLFIFMAALVCTYIFLNLGPRILGLIFLIKKIILKKSKDIDQAILLSIMLSLVFPIFFIQRGVWWNTVQFLFPVFLLLNIYTAEYIVGLKNKYIRIGFIICIIFFSIPYAVDALYGFVTYPGVIRVSDSEKIALTYLKELPEGVVYSPLYSQDALLNKGGIIPLYNHVDSSYIPAYSGKQMFYANYVQLELLNLPHQRRRDKIKAGDCTSVSTFKYAYIQEGNNNDTLFTKCILKNKAFKKIYDHSPIMIYSKIK